MILRAAAHVLVVVMLLASGRLLACGLECLHEAAVPAAASCHQESAPVTALNGDAVHACLTVVVDARMNAAKPVAAHAMVTAPPGTPFITTVRPAEFVSRGLSFALRVGSPQSAAPSVLRI